MKKKSGFDRENVIMRNFTQNNFMKKKNRHGKCFKGGCVTLKGGAVKECRGFPQQYSSVNASVNVGRSVVASVKGRPLLLVPGRERGRRRRGCRSRTDCETLTCTPTQQASRRPRFPLGHAAVAATTTPIQSQLNSEHQQTTVHSRDEALHYHYLFNTNNDTLARDPV